MFIRIHLVTTLLFLGPDPNQIFSSKPHSRNNKCLTKHLFQYKAIGFKQTLSNSLYNYYLLDDKETYSKVSTPNFNSSNNVQSINIFYIHLIKTSVNNYIVTY